MIIRQLRQSDKEKWISFFQGLSKDTLENRYFHSVKNEDIDIAEWYWEYMINESISLIAEVEDNKIVGCIELYINKSTNRGEIAITIADSRQNEGIGTLLMNRIHRVAKKHKLSSIWFITHNTNMEKMAKNFNFIKNKNTWEKELK